MGGIEQGVLGREGIPEEGSPPKCGAFVENRPAHAGSRGLRAMFCPLPKEAMGQACGPGHGVICSWAIVVLASSQEVITVPVSIK